MLLLLFGAFAAGIGATFLINYIIVWRSIIAISTGIYEYHSFSATERFCADKEVIKAAKERSANDAYKAMGRFGLLGFFSLALAGDLKSKVMSALGMKKKEEIHAVDIAVSAAFFVFAAETALPRSKMDTWDEYFEFLVKHGCVFTHEIVIAIFTMFAFINKKYCIVLDKSYMREVLLPFDAAIGKLKKWKKENTTWRASATVSILTSIWKKGRPDFMDDEVDADDAACSQ